MRSNGCAFSRSRSRLSSSASHVLTACSHCADSGFPARAPSPPPPAARSSCCCCTAASEAEANSASCPAPAAPVDQTPEPTLRRGASAAAPSGHAAPWCCPSRPDCLSSHTAGPPTSSSVTARCSVRTRQRFARAAPAAAWVRRIDATTARRRSCSSATRYASERAGSLPLRYATTHGESRGDAHGVGGEVWPRAKAARRRREVAPVRRLGGRNAAAHAKQENSCTVEALAAVAYPLHRPPAPRNARYNRRRRLPRRNCSLRSLRLVTQPLQS